MKMNKNFKDFLRKNPSRKKSVSFCLPWELMHELKFYCRMRGLSPNFILEELLKKEMGETKEDDILWKNLFNDPCGISCYRNTVINRFCNIGGNSNK